ncbi:hypothetical protein F0160_22475 [Paraburkholderia sp. JPY303]|uniref:hypothetical protein n=1 Tax=Paraburkholderia atlantica TaxID=2654982 RepID=UPI0015912D3C|nr:hypothetical protein [Paraburkholderia atlantica]NUY33254.1 hypothetical protein [Paraburkholderia atlantica]
MTISEPDRIEQIKGIIEDEAMTIPEIAEAMNLYPSSIRGLVYRLHRNSEIYIDRWTISGKAYAYTAMYQVGNMQDAPKPPKMSHAERKEKMRIYRANYEETKAERAEREYREKVRKELGRPAFRHWQDLALFGEPA